MISSSFRPLDTQPRRLFSFADPRLQARLAIAILAVTSVFSLLAVGNSYAAYGTLLELAISEIPEMFSDDLMAQTRRYIRVTSTLAVAYAAAVGALSLIFVHRLTGPLVALERHARALETGDYSSRVALRAGASAYAGLAAKLNGLAARLEADQEPSEV
jgi:HAMP domain-containing protein